jgi:hypothetical protein
MAITHVRTTQGSGSLGANSTITITSDTAGDLCLLSVRATGFVLPTITEGGWTTIISNTDGFSRILFGRVKQSGDTTFTLDIPGTANHNYVLDVVRGAQMPTNSIAAANQSAAGQVIPFPSLVIANATSASFLVGTWAGSNSVPLANVPANYTELNDASGVIWTGWDTTISAGALDPADMNLNLTGSTHRMGWQIEIPPAVTTHDLAAALTGTSTETFTVPQREATFAAALTGASSESLAISREATLASAMTGTSSESLALTRTRFMASELSGASSESFEITRTRFMAAGLTGASSESFALTREALMGVAFTAGDEVIVTTPPPPIAIVKGKVRISIGGGLYV